MCLMARITTGKFSSFLSQWTVRTLFGISSCLHCYTLPLPIPIYSPTMTRMEEEMGRLKSKTLTASSGHSPNLKKSGHAAYIKEK